MCQFTRLSDVSGESMKTTALISCFVFCAQFGSSLAARPLSERLAADIEMAEHSILASLVVHKSSEQVAVLSDAICLCRSRWC